MTCVDFLRNFVFLLENQDVYGPRTLLNRHCCVSLSAKDSTRSRAETWLTVYRPNELLSPSKSNMTRRAFRSKSNSLEGEIRGKLQQISRRVFSSKSNSVAMAISL